MPNDKKNDNNLNGEIYSLKNNKEEKLETKSKEVIVGEELKPTISLLEQAISSIEITIERDFNGRIIGNRIIIKQ